MTDIKSVKLMEERKNQLDKLYLENIAVLKRKCVDYFGLNYEKEIELTKGFKSNYLLENRLIDDIQGKILLILESYFTNYSNKGSRIWLENIQEVLERYNIELTTKDLVNNLLKLSEVKRSVGKYSFIPLFSVFSISKNSAGIVLKVVINPYF